MTDYQVTAIATAVGMYLLLVTGWLTVEAVIRFRREAKVRERTEAVRERLRERGNEFSTVRLVIVRRPGSSIPVRVFDEVSGRWYGFDSLDSFARWSSSGLVRYLDGGRSEGDRLTFSPSGSGWGRVLDHPAIVTSRPIDLLDGVGGANVRNDFGTVSRSRK